MTPDLLTRLITDLRGLVATFGPAADLVEQLAGGAGPGTQAHTRRPLTGSGLERADVPSCPAPPAPYVKRAGAGTPASVRQKG